jgi:putative MATE family efflux protein
MLIISVIIGTSVGIGACLSQRLGAKDQEGVNSIAANGLFLAFLTYLFFLFFGLFLTKPYFSWQTNNPEIYRFVVDYLSIYMVFSLGSIIQITLQRMLQSTGKTMLSMISQVIGAVFNIIFDPILIFGLYGFPKLGVKGAAIATVAGQFIAMGIALYFNITKNKEIQFNFKKFRPGKKIISRIYHIGAPAIIMQSLNSLMAFSVNIILINITSTAVAAFGIYIKVQNFIFMPVYGLNNGVISITAFNYGARNKNRVDAAIKFGVLYAVGIMLIGTILIQIFAKSVLSLFDASSELMVIGVRAMRIISISYVLVGFTMIAQSLCQALGNGIYSLIITLARVVIILLPVLYLFSRLFPLNNIWWAFTLAEIFATVIGTIFLRNIYTKKVAALSL